MDLGLEIGMAGEMGDRPGLREADDTDIEGGCKCVWPGRGPEPCLNVDLNLKLSGMTRGGRR